MFGKEKNRKSMKERLPGISKPEYEFTTQKVLLFLTGVPLSGKSTIAPLVAASVKGCAIQSLDIFRLMAQELEKTKQEEHRNPFVHYGSCDSYKLIGDGQYSPQGLIDGYMAYSRAVSSLLGLVVPKLEAQGVQDLLFEGVQLAPDIIEPYLKGKDARLIILRTNEPRLLSNRREIFGDNAEMEERYSTERLLVLQDEILRQSRKIPSDKIAVIDNIGEYTETALQVLQFLSKTGLIKQMD